MANEIEIYGSTLAQIEEIERLSGKSVLTILSESVNLSNWLYKERRNGGRLWLRGTDPEEPLREVFFL
jgi:hypothetical protein